MPAPPTDISAEELFLKLIEPRPSAIMDWPTKAAVRPKDRPAKVRIMVLPGLEHERAGMEGRQKFKQKYNLTAEDMKDPSIEKMVADAAAREIIAKCVHYVKPFPGSENEPGGARYPMCFRDSDHVNQLSAHEVAVLFRAYQIVQDKFGPYEGGGMGHAEQDAWIKRLMEAGAAAPLELLSMPLPHLLTFSSSSVERLCSLSDVLASQWSDLPPTLASALEPFLVDTSSFGKPAAGSVLDGSDESADVEDPILNPDEVLEVDDAVAVAQRLRDGG
jgi:hypothetical protein